LRERRAHPEEAHWGSMTLRVTAKPQRNELPPLPQERAR
jgi:hypothetical protein